MNMKKRNVLGLIAVPIVLAACLAGAATPMQDQPAPPRPERGPIVAQLTVRGEAQLERPADQLHLRLGVVTNAVEAAQAMQDNSRAMEGIIAAIQNLGLGKGEYETGRFNVQPQYAPPPRQPQPEWRPKIAGYQVTNTLHIKTKKLELAGDLIQAATDAGANTVESIYFDLADPRTHRAEAIEEATKNAVADANVLAKASNQKLVRVLSINLDHAAAPPPLPQYDHMARGMAGAEMASAPPITPGEITVTASVTLVFEIAPLN
jgi:uncharacterized protein YggE